MINPVAEKLNSVLKGTSVYSMLSDLGRRMYTPTGFPEQSQQANREATSFNATAGVAKEYGHLITLDVVKQYFSDKLSPEEIFDYSPMAGQPELRQAWKNDIIEKNPSLRGKYFSLPVVTGGITSSLSTALALFVNPGDCVVLPELYWENYYLMISQFSGAQMVTFPLLSSPFGSESYYVSPAGSTPYDVPHVGFTPFTPSQSVSATPVSSTAFNAKGLDLSSFEKAIDSVNQEKIVIILNFPNNPTGYSPTLDEAVKIREILVKRAESGKKIVVMLDDAYFSLFHEENVCKESLFSYLCDSHENILAVKLDGATKEEMAWGLRIAFITFAFKGMSEEACLALTQKTVGIIRCTISSCSTVAQSVLTKVLEDPLLASQRKAGAEKVKKHYDAIKAALSKYRDSDILIPLPFNSGYFVTFKTKCDAEKLRLKLLKDYKGGIIRIDENTIRFAHCSIDPEKMQETVDIIYSVARSLC